MKVVLSTIAAGFMFLGVSVFANETAEEVFKANAGVLLTGTNQNQDPCAVKTTADGLIYHDFSSAEISQESSGLLARYFSKKLIGKRLVHKYGDAVSCVIMGYCIKDRLEITYSRSLRILTLEYHGREGLEEICRF